MKHSKFHCRLSYYLMAIVLAGICSNDLMAEDYPFAAEFNTAGDAEGWTIGPTTPASMGALIQKVSTNGTDGVLTGSTAATWQDPQIILSGAIDLDPILYSTWDSIEIRIRQLSTDGISSSPWASFGTLGLFAPGNTNLKVIGDDAGSPWVITHQDDNWIVASADISFMNEASFSRIRIDPIGGPDCTGQNFEVDYIRMTAKGVVPEGPTFLDSLSTLEDPPNIVFILIDDMGWRDLACYGSDLYETPSIDAFAETGVLFTDAYTASPLCSPTRASILTGLEPGRLRFTTPSGHLPQVVLSPSESTTSNTHYKATVPGTCTRLSNKYITFAEVFKALGYSTAFMGKWHLGSEPYIPENQGFDVVVGGREHPGPPGPGSYFAPWNCETLPVVPTGTHICDVVTDEAIKYVTAVKDDPFMLCLWYYDVHAPFQSKQNLTDKYTSKINDDHIQRSALMGGMVENLDDNVGRFLDKINSLGLDDNTIVILTSDNGGNMYDCPLGEVATNNYPLRAGKGNNYEGGVRVPLIVRVPGMTTPNTTSSVVTSTVDHYATMLDLIDVPFPKSLLTDGVSFVPALKGEDYDREPIYSTFCHRTPRTGNLPNISMRDKEWRLYRFYFDGPNREHRYELYNLDEDISETNNLAEANPDIVTRMVALLDAHIEEAEILESQLNQNYIGNAADGWWGAAGTTISILDNALHIAATGNNPYVETDLIPSFAGTKFYFTFDMKSDASGKGKISWVYDKADAYSDDLSASFDVTHDGQWHQYKVAIDVTSNIALFNILACTSAGTVDIKNLKMETVDGHQLRSWALTHDLKSTTALTEIDDSKFIISPNPVKQNLNIAFDEVCDLEIFNMDGKKVYAAASSSISHDINVKTWNDGVYIANLKINDKSLSKMFVKE